MQIKRQVSPRAVKLTLKMPLSSFKNKIQVASSSPLSFCCHETEPNTATESNDLLTTSETPLSAPLLALWEPQMTNANRRSSSSLLFHDQLGRRRRCATPTCERSTRSTDSSDNLQLIESELREATETTRNQSRTATNSGTKQVAAPRTNGKAARSHPNTTKLSSHSTLFILINCLLLISWQQRQQTSSIADAKSIEDTKASTILANDLSHCDPPDCKPAIEQNDHNSSTTATIRPSSQVTESPRSTLSELFARLTQAFNGENTISTTPLARVQKGETTTPQPTTSTGEQEETSGPEDDSTGAGDDDHDAEGCESISADESAEGKNLTNHERLVNLQTCLQRKIKKRLKGGTLTGMEMVQKLSLSGGCTNSLWTLASGLGDTKAYAFKFLDATAKIPSGVMYGLLSDFGDFDQCLSIRSNPNVLPQNEAEEGTFSGKYCLLSVRMNYHIELKPNETVPEGIDPDGVLWDELMRNYWISNSTKGFQIGVCVPSRCTNDDLQQLYRYVANSYNIQGELMSCQDSNDLRKQLTADLLQWVIIYIFVTLFSLSILGSLVERYFLHLILERSSSLQAQARVSLSTSSSSTTVTAQDNHDSFTANERTDTKSATTDSSRNTNDLFVSMCQDCRLNTILNVLICFSLRRNWEIFINKQNSSQDLLNSNQWLSRDTHSSMASSFGQQRGGRQTATAKWRQTNESSPTANTVTADDYDAPPSSPSSTSLSFSDQATKSTDSLSNESGSVSKSLDNRSVDINRFRQQLTVKIQPSDYSLQPKSPAVDTVLRVETGAQTQRHRHSSGSIIGHLSGLKLIVIVWITIGHSFLYPSANNYQYYRSIINMNVTRDSVWFATTNFTLGIDMLLYMSGLLFVYKLARLNSHSASSSGLLSSLLNNNTQQPSSPTKKTRQQQGFVGLVFQMIVRKVLRFWPTYLSVIALAIVIPLVSDGPMWPEMVQKRLGETCRRNFWANLLIVNNIFFSESEICLPSSWFVSVLMQLFLVGSLIIVLAKQVSFRLACLVSILLLVCSSAVSFAMAYYLNISAPVIRMDESFVLELDDTIFKMYTNIFNNLGPFMIGLIGGLLLLRHETQLRRRNYYKTHVRTISSPKSSDKNGNELGGKIIELFIEFLLGFAVTIIAICVLSSVFYQHYTRFWASFYWAFHRIGWSIVTGYVIHQCATGKWKLLSDLLSLSTFIPLSKLVFIAYLVYPIYIHLHSGFVRDGLHVSIYNMLNIYVTRLVLTFSTALAIHLFVELPFCSLEEMFLQSWLARLAKRRTIQGAHHHDSMDKSKMKNGVGIKNSSTANELSSMTEDTKLSKFHPLLAVAPFAESKIDDDDKGTIKIEGTTKTATATQSAATQDQNQNHSNISQFAAKKVELH